MQAVEAAFEQADAGAIELAALFDHRFNDTVSLRDAELSRAAVAIGSEGRGLSAELLSKCEKTIKIPMSPRCESLNAAVAASVVLWEMYR